MTEGGVIGGVGGSGTELVLLVLLLLARLLLLRYEIPANVRQSLQIGLENACDVQRFDEFMWCYVGCMQLCGGREQKGSQERNLIEMRREGYPASEMAAQKATGFCVPEWTTKEERNNTKEHILISDDMLRV